MGEVKCWFYIDEILQCGDYYLFFFKDWEEKYLLIADMAEDKWFFTDDSEETERFEDFKTFAEWWVYQDDELPEIKVIW